VYFFNIKMWKLLTIRFSDVAKFTALNPLSLLTSPLSNVKVQVKVKLSLCFN
jgi:hypothetical protein